MVLLAVRVDQLHHFLLKGHVTCRDRSALALISCPPFFRGGHGTLIDSYIKITQQFRTSLSKEFSGVRGEWIVGRQNHNVCINCALFWISERQLKTNSRKFLSTQYVIGTLISFNSMFEEVVIIILILQIRGSERCTSGDGGLGNLD